MQKEFTLHTIIEKSFDFSSYSEEEKQDMITDTAGLIMEAALLRALGEGGESVQAEFDAFMETEPDDKAMNEYVKNKIPDFEKFVLEELQQLKQETLSEE